MRSRSGGGLALLASLVVTLAAPLVLTACGNSSQDAVSPPSSSGPPAATSPSASASPVSVSQLLDSATSVAGLRSQLKSVGPDALYGKPFRASPPSVITALEDYFATVDPSKGEFNGASSVEFVWAFTMVRAPGGHLSTPTRQYVDAYFLAEGDDMMYAGSMGPGFNNRLMRLSRQSTSDSWHVDGWYP